MVRRGRGLRNPVSGEFQTARYQVLHTALIDKVEGELGKQKCRRDEVRLKRLTQLDNEASADDCRR